MPFSLLPTEVSPDRSGSINRRSMLKTGIAAFGTATLGTSMLTGTSVASAVAGDTSEVDWVALVSDTHIDQNPAAIARDNNMTSNFARVVSGILAEPVKPKAVLIDGDLAYGIGRTGDYEQFLKLIDPVTKAGIPVHMALGNHDDRDNFRKVIGAAGLADPGRAKAVESHHTLDLTLAGVRFLVLDSLQRPNFTPGLVGPAQVEWLGETLKTLEDVPTVLFVHHNPALIPTQGLTDTAAVYEAIVARPQVKAMIFGHTHVWNPFGQHEGIKLVNLPAVAYPFNAAQPLGWTKFRPIQGGAVLTLNALDPKHPAHARPELFNWR
jgi:3',5'-cyclic AMP phosphodiesterase CpdA